MSIHFQWLGRRGCRIASYRAAAKLVNFPVPYRRKSVAVPKSFMVRLFAVGTRSRSGPFQAGLLTC